MYWSILLDLLGAPDPTFYSYFSNTQKWYSLLMSIENKLAGLRKFESYSYGQPAQKYFQPYSMEVGIEDDHIPFLQRGKYWFRVCLDSARYFYYRMCVSDVPILHIIPYPFPKVWHKPSDNRDNIDLTTTENINKILRVFVASYLHIDN